MTARIFNIQHFSTGDGPGIRTTVFFHGCNLRCPWCHNPEALYGRAEEREAEEAIAEVMADTDFYRRSEGGVTLSGGEPLLGGEGFLYLARRFKENGLNVIVDTALAARDMPLAEAAKHTDCFYVDVKTADGDKFRSIGGSPEVFKDNLDRLISLGADSVFRVPLIPGFNMDGQSVNDIIDFIKPYKKPVSLLPFHRLGSAKYRQLGIEYKYAETEPPAESEVERIKRMFAENGIEEADI